MMRRCFCTILISAALGFNVYGQIVTAEDYLGRVADKYSGFSDYEANVAIRQGNSAMQGRLSHLRPQFLRIDFSVPSNQVIVFNGEQLTIYLPEYSAILNQTVTGNRSGANMATAAGLAMLRRSYAPAYISSPNPVPLEESGEMVVKLRLTPRSGGQTYKEILLSIEPNSLIIRRMEGISFAGSMVRFDFTNVKVNQGIPEARFIYDSPASANMYNNFLFRDRD
ncbi:MAG: outer membrane lipoprotein carrier protein LolA [Spirochaetaceae bacterium]|jgi:outer membrane lipoprotein-sorting protein|nr:outer membrane lipoprotein carrier protein LolA [Spirochaetaceae bacterium]